MRFFQKSCKKSEHLKKIQMGLHQSEPFNHIKGAYAYIK